MISVGVPPGSQVHWNLPTRKYGISRGAARQSDPSKSTRSTMYYYWRRRPVARSVVIYPYDIFISPDAPPGSQVIANTNNTTKIAKERKRSTESTKSKQTFNSEKNTWTPLIRIKVNLKVDKCPARWHANIGWSKLDLIPLPPAPPNKRIMAASSITCYLNGNF